MLDVCDQFAGSAVVTAGEAGRVSSGLFSDDLDQRIQAHEDELTLAPRMLTTPLFRVDPLLDRFCVETDGLLADGPC